MKSIIVNSPVYSFFARMRQIQRKVMWDKKTYPVPHLVKQRTIREYAEKFNVRVLAETGTYLGDMVHAMRNRFEHIYSIELDNALHQRAVKRFRKYNNIYLIHGDSGRRIPEVTKKVNQPVLFWLDGHYSGGLTARTGLNCPIFNELTHILDRPYDDILLIDDAHCFVGKNDYPTLSEIADFVKTRKPHFIVDVGDDIIRIYSPSQ